MKYYLLVYDEDIHEYFLWGVWEYIDDIDPLLLKYNKYKILSVDGCIDGCGEEYSGDTHD